MSRGLSVRVSDHDQRTFQQRDHTPSFRTPRRRGRRAAGFFLVLAAVLSGFPGGDVAHAQTTGVIDFGLVVPEISVGEAAHHRERRVNVRFKGLQPTGTVTVTVTSADTTVATVTPATLSFGPADWMQSQEITVSAVDDHLHNDMRRTTQIEFVAKGVVGTA